MTSEKITIEEAAAFLLEHDRYTILSHANPDGDTAGCAYALCSALRSIGKKANVRCADKISDRFSFMWANVPKEEFDEETVISVDVADRLLLGKIDEEYGGRVELAIDHHKSHVCFEKRLLNEPEAAACAQTVFKVIGAMKIPLDKDIAACLYTAIVTDSGCFKFSSVSPETHRIAAQLLEFDFGFAELNYNLFDLKTKARVALEERIYHDMEYYFDGKCAVVVLPKSAIKDVDSEDTNGISSLPRQVMGVEVSAIIKEKDDGWKASLRSNRYVDVQELCMKFGGGGHIRAAGCSFKGITAEEVKQQLLAEIGKVLK